MTSSEAARGVSTLLQSGRAQQQVREIHIFAATVWCDHTEGKERRKIFSRCVTRILAIAAKYAAPARTCSEA